MVPSVQTESASGCNGQALLERSALYRNFCEQREEVLRHKWVLSERAGHDVGFEAALLDWMINHRAEWASRRRARQRG